MMDEAMRGSARRVSGAVRTAAALLALLLAGGVAACGEAPFELTLSALENQRTRWEESGVLDYRFEYRELCVCGQSAERRATIEVRGGEVVSVTGTGAPDGWESITAYPTIDDLFDRIEEAVRDEAAALSVSYDPDLGYPTEIIIDYDYGAEHDEVNIDATGLIVL